MPDHKIGTREEWQAARNELANLESEQAERNEEIKRRRLELPCVRVEKEYEFGTEDGKKTLAELFDGRSQLLAYNIMFGPDFTIGACAGCTSLGDGVDSSLVPLITGRSSTARSSDRMNRSLEPSGMPEALEQRDKLLLNLGASVERS